MVLSWFKDLKKGLSKSSNKIGDGLKSIFKKKKIDSKTLEELEELLISADVGVSFASEVIDKIRRVKLENTSIDSVKKIIDQSIINILKPLEKKEEIKKTPCVILIVGVNGVGKTATVGKLAHKFSNKHKKIGIVAADTFRAAAVEKLEVW